jgi:cell pole-organizing protein PopZ
MNINRHNYEEFFILYMDNELSADERKAVEAFVQQQPDLKEELDLLLHYKLEPDASVVFTGKEELMKVNGDTPITLNNYQDSLLLYIDGELPDDRIFELETLIKNEPAVQLDLALLQKSKMQPENIVFAYKDQLYRKEEKVRRILPLPWMRIAAAALLVMLVSTAILLINRKPATVTGKPDIAKKGVSPSTNQVKEGSLPNTPLNKINNSASTNNDVAVDINPTQEKKTMDRAVIKNGPALLKDKNKEMAVNNDALSNKNNGIVIKNTQQAQEKNNKLINVQSPERKEEKILAVNDNLKSTNNLPRPINAINTDKNDVLNNATAKDNASKNISANPLTNDKVTNQNSGSSNTGNPAIEFASNKGTDQTLEEGSSNKKSRGLFRKIARTFEKRTNITPGDDNRLLVAGLSFKLK